METIQVVSDSKLLRAANQAARHAKPDQSALVRDAVREHPRRLEIRELEERDRKGYETGPRADGELGVWESEATWPRGERGETFVVFVESRPKVQPASQRLALLLY
jgi:hypothetical protein